MADTKRNKRKVLSGVVKSNKMDKTCVVVVERRFRHPLYEKIVRTSKSYYAHDAENKCNIGDKVKIVSARPMSRMKKWRVLEITGKTGDIS